MAKKVLKLLMLFEKFWMSLITNLKSWLQNNDIQMYSTHNERKSAVVERFIRILKGEIYKYMTSVSKNVYINKSDDIVN